MKGKIYRLSNGEKHYYGSTTQDLKTRLGNHIANIQDKRHGTSSSILFDSVEYNVSIDLMEEIEYENKDDLLWLERWWIENNDCVNILRPILSDKERKEIIKEDKKKYNEKLKYDEKRYDKRLKYIKNYNHQNKEKRDMRFICECGCETNKHHIARHRKTKKHIKLMENKTENIKITITAEQQRHGQAD